MAGLPGDALTEPINLAFVLDFGSRIELADGLSTTDCLPQGFDSDVIWDGQNSPPLGCEGGL